MSTRLAPVDGGIDSGIASGSDAGFDAGDSGSDSGVGTDFTLALALHRSLESGEGDVVLAAITATAPNGSLVSGLDVSVDAGGVVVSAVEDAGTYLVAVTPSFTSGELILTATATGSAAVAQATALVLPQIGLGWDQPQPVAGLVDTPGTEDSSTVSPDGQWLIVGSYSPMDLLCCGTGCGQNVPALDADNPQCLDVLGPVGGPARPGMPGAERVSGGRLVNPSDPQMCAVLIDGGPVPIPDDGGSHPLAIPLVAAYGFHRQADGSYAEPFLIDIGADGFVGAPFCFTFLGSGSGDAGESVPMLFGYNIDAPDSGKPHPWYTRLTLGRTNELGSYACNSPDLPGYPTFTPGSMVALPVGPSGQQAGNTSLAALGGSTYLLSDDESAVPPYIEFARAFDGGYTDWQPMALPDPELDRRQPVLAGTRLFYFRDRGVASVSWDGSDPASTSAFSGFEVELSPEAAPSGRVGEVIAIGQPTFALVDGHVQMFFVYYRRSATGADGQIGSVLLR